MLRTRRRVVVLLAAVAAAALLAVLILVVWPGGGNSGVTEVDGNVGAVLYSAGHRPTLHHTNRISSGGLSSGFVKCAA